MRVLCVAFALLFAVPAFAEVTRVEILSRADLTFAGYEKIVGRVFFTVDPKDPHNAVVVDLDKAPKNAAGRVEFSSDFYIVRPKTGGNGVAIVDIVNRGGKTVIRNFNRVGPTLDPDVGDGFLLTRGFTVVGVGWEFDLPATEAPARSAAVAAVGRATEDLLRIRVPVATDGGAPITGIVKADFTPDGPGPSRRVTELPAYTPVDAAAADATLTVRDGLTAQATPVPRAEWRLSGTTVTMTRAFEPGRIYQLSFRAANPPVAGLGLAAVRDFAAWIKHDPSALTKATHVYAFGSSQSGRFLRTFLYQGFNADERGRQVLDATIVNIAGAARLDLNRRWATPTIAAAQATEFPFADRALEDPVSRQKDGLLENARAGKHQPKVFYTNSDVEYWSSHGRAAALVHTTPDGARDLDLPDNARAYFFAGTQHGPAAFPPAAAGIGQQRGNPMDYWWIHRSLLVALDDWVRKGTTPPATAVPRIAAGTLVKGSAVAFPDIPGVQSPKTLSAAARVPNAFLAGGAGAGTPIPLLVPQVDADGNDRAGIRLPEQAVPLATYTGWNFRSTALGGTHQTIPLLGSYVPFARTKAEREQRRDPRPSIEERYPGRDRYLSLARDVANGLVRDRFLLQEDVDPVMRRAGAHWDVLMGTVTTSSRR